jgi:uncharacterized protein YkwD
MSKKMRFLKFFTIGLVFILLLSTEVAYADYQPNFENIKVQVIKYLNELRQLNGLNPLRYDEVAERVAQKRAMAQGKNTLSHDGLTQDIKEIKDPIYGTENLIYLHPDGYNSDDEIAKEIIVLWYIDKGIKNKGHHKQMLNPFFDFTGVGIKQEADGYIYISQVMASDIDIDPKKISKETVDAINAFYEYFNSGKLNKSTPLN